MYEQSKKNSTKQLKQATDAQHHSNPIAPQNTLLTDNRPETTVQRKIQSMAQQYQPNVIQQKTNKTGLPNQLKNGIEQLSGYSMDDVKVHHNSAKPAQVQAHAYTQGNQIHLASGQEKHLPHEAWHVVQQKQGRVKPTMQLKGKVAINDEHGLEKEADHMGAKAASSQYDSRATTQMVAMHNSHWVLQRTTFAKEASSGLYGDRTYTREHDGKTESIEAEPHGLKMQVLRDFALDVTAWLKSESKPGEVGPHVAVSRSGGVLYIALNSKFADKTMVSSADLKLTAEHVAQQWLSTLPQQLKDDSELQHAKRWLVSKGGEHKKERIASGNIKAFGDTGNASGTEHGEMRILGYITDPANNALKTKPTWGLGADKKKVIRIGGTKFDCLDCHEAEHGQLKSDNDPGSAHISTNPQLHSQSSYDQKLSAKHFITLSPGTHGIAYSGWKHPAKNKAGQPNVSKSHGSFPQPEDAMKTLMNMFTVGRDENSKLRKQLGNGANGPYPKEKWDEKNPRNSLATVRQNQIAMEQKKQDLLKKCQTLIDKIHQLESEFAIAPTKYPLAQDDLHKQHKHLLEEKNALVAQAQPCKAPFDELTRIVGEFNLEKKLLVVKSIKNISHELKSQQQAILKALEDLLETKKTQRDLHKPFWSNLVESVKALDIDKQYKKVGSVEFLNTLQEQIIKVKPQSKEPLEQLIKNIEQAKGVLTQLMTLGDEIKQVEQAINLVKALKL